MARSFVYNRPLDAKILLNPENPNHEFQFNTLLEIKKEVENDPLDSETDIPPAATVTNSSGPDEDHDRELGLANGSNQYEESEDHPHPKLVIKFRDLWRKSEQSIDYPKKKKKSKSRESKNDLPTVRKLRGNKRQKSELSVSSENRITRSSLSRPKASNSNSKTESESDCLQQKLISDKEEKQDVWNFGRITRLKKNLNTLCESCGMCFRSDRQLQAHKRYYTADGEYHCTTCDIRFSRRFQLSRHVKVAHSPLGNEDNYKFKCHLCIDRFERKASLIAHVTHLHNKQVVTFKRNTNKEILTSFAISHARKKKKKRKRASARKSRRNRKQIVAINSNDEEMQAHDDSRSTKDSNDSAGIWYNKDEWNDDSPGNQLKDDNLDLSTRSTQLLTNSNYSEHKKTLMQEKSDEAEVKVQRQAQSSIKDSTKNPNKLRDAAQERIDTLPFSSRLLISKKNRASIRFLERNEDGNQTHRWSQTGSENVPRNVPPRLEGDLVDHLGNKVGNWCVSEAFNQSDKTDPVSDYNSASTTVDLADESPGIEMANVLLSIRSSTSTTTVSNSPAINTMNSATYSDQKLTENDELSAERKSTHATEENYMMSKVLPHLDGVDVRLKLSPQSEELEEQVGLVLSDQVSEDFETVRNNVKADDDAILECNNYGNDLIQDDNFGERYKSAFLHCEDEEVSDGSCESISLEMAGSSSNASLADPLNLDSHNVNMLTSCNTHNDPKIKDVRICLVKLENMLNISNKNTPPKSSTLEDDSLVKTETTCYNPCEKQLTDKIRSWQDSRWKHNSGEVNLVQESSSIIREKRVTTNPHREVLSNENRLAVREVGQETDRVSEKRCFLCDEVFETTFATASHYLSVHTEAGVLRCCLCYSNFKNLGKLRIHIFKHYRMQKKKLKIFCVVCKKSVDIPNLTRLCYECNLNPENNQSDSREAQFPNLQDLSAREKVHASDDDSVSLIERSPVSMPRDREESNITMVDRESARNDGKVDSPKTCGEKLKNFKYSARNRVCHESSRLKDRLSTARADVDYREYVSKSRDCKKTPKKHFGNKNSLPKLSVEKKKHLKSKNIHTHDKLCKKKSYARQKLRFSQINNKHQHLIRQHHIRGNAKKCFDHKCDICGLNCCCRKSLEIHKTRYLTNGNNVCNICGLTFAWKHVLVMHMKTAHNPKVTFHGRVRCEICNQGFYNKKFLRIHLAHFHNIKYFQCRICRIRFDTCRSLNNHRGYYSKNLSRRCRTCGQSFKCKYMLEYHKVQVHNREKLKAYKYSCDVCNFAFLDELLLQAHIGHFHNIQDREAEKKGPNMVTKEQLPKNTELSLKTENDCIDLNVTRNISTVREHVNEIHRAQGITEDVVGKTIRTHTSGEYKCGLCKLSFNDPSAILNHEWEFSNDGANVCIVCNRKFMTNSLLKNHKIKHYQTNVVRKYECYICKEDFSRLDRLKMHGLHLHGPQFAWDIHNRSMLESRKNRDRGMYDTIELMTRNEGPRSGKILLFRRIFDHRPSIEFLRRHSNEDAYCCIYCKTNFSSETLLEDHVKQHAYRAYYTNSSRYLCLICKNKFRTNDILRAHVIHCHTANKTESNLSEPGCSKDSVSTKPMKSKTSRNDKQTSINSDDGEAESVAANSRSKRSIRNKPSNSEECKGVQRSNGAPPSKKRKLSNPTGEVNTFQSDRAHRTSVSSGVEYKADNKLKCNYLGGGNDRNFSESELVEPSYSGITSRIDSDIIPGEVKLFTFIVKDMQGSEKYTCTICTATFHSVAQFKEHFASAHVKDEAYLCTSCGEIFSAILDLKYHVLKHEEEPRNYVCCNKKFVSMTDFVRHKLSHEEDTGEKQDRPNTQLSPLSRPGSPMEIDDESIVDKTGTLCKCEICDKPFPDFKTMLKHWDSCIDTNGLQCDLCRATFKSLNLFRVHKLTHQEKNQNSNNAQNRWSYRLNGDRTDPASTQSSIVDDNEVRRRTTIVCSAKVNANEKSERPPILANKIFKQNELLRLRKIMVKPFAKILQNGKNNECRDNERRENDTDDATELRSGLGSTQGTQSSKQPGILKTAKRMISIDNVGRRASLEMKGNGSTPSPTVRPTILRQAKSITPVSLPDDQVSNNIPRIVNGNRLLQHPPVQDSNKISKQHFVINDFGLRFQQNEHKVQRLTTSQPNSSNSSQNTTSIQSTASSSIIIGNMRFESTELGQKSRSNDCEVTKPLNLLSASLKGADSYYFCIQPAAHGSDDMNNAVTTDSGKKSQPNNGSGNILSGLVPLNSGVSPTYFLCVKPTSESSSKCSTQTVTLNDSKPKSYADDHITKRLPALLEKSPNIVLNPIHASDLQRIANNSNGKNSQDVASNDSVIRSHLNSNKDTRVSTLPATAGTSTGGNPSPSQKTTTKSKNIPAEKSASNKELTLSKQVVRCSFCNLLFAEKAKLIKHMESHRTDNQCPACGLTFSNERALQQHLPEHKCSTCTQCNMITFFSDAVANSKGTNQHCSVCNTVLPLPTRKLNRSATNSGRQVMKCGICMATFGTISQMTVHFKMVHSSFVCGICESKFSTTSSLHSHMRSHGIDSREALQCNKCKQYFTTQSDLATHTLTHFTNTGN